MSLVEMSVFIPYYLCIGTNSGGGGISRTQSCCRVKIFEDALPCDFFFFFLLPSIYWQFQVIFLISCKIFLPCIPLQQTELPECM